MNKKYFIGLGVLIVIILVGIIVWKAPKHANTPPIKTKLNQRAPLPKEVTVTLTTNGFTPSQVTISVGSAIRWKNESGSQQTVNSDNYPINQLHRELNFGVFNNGSSVTHTFTTPGTFRYHNQFHHEQTGKIIVVR